MLTVPAVLTVPVVWIVRATFGVVTGAGTGFDDVGTEVVARAVKAKALERIEDFMILRNLFLRGGLIGDGAKPFYSSAFFGIERALRYRNREKEIRSLNITAALLVHIP